MKVYIVQINYKSGISVLFPCTKFAIKGPEYSWTGLNVEHFQKVQSTYPNLRLTLVPLKMNVDNIESIWTYHELTLADAN